jgi:hypothetical protein
MSTKREWRSLSLGGGVVLVTLVAALFVQHLRHGWPFSLHHGAGMSAGARVEVASP